MANVRIGRTALVVAVDGAITPPTPPAVAGNGLPARSDRSFFGPTMRDERLQVNPKEEVNADQVNLLWWQLAGIGLACPIAVFTYDPGADNLVYGAFSWDGVLYEAAVAPYLSVFKNGTGDFLFSLPQYVDGIPDENGNALPTAVTITSIVAQLAGFASSAGQRAEVIKLADNAFSVKTYAGNPLVAVDHPVTIQVF